MRLEVFTTEMKQEWPKPSNRVVPAEWWVWSANGEWTDIGHIGLRGLIRLLFYRRRNYWPMRITDHGSVLWMSRAAEGVKP